MVSAKFTIATALSLVLPAVLPWPAEAQSPDTQHSNTSEFIFSGRSVTSSRYPRAYLTLDHSISVGELSQRFSDYEVNIGQCEWPLCLDIQSPSGSLEVNYDEAEGRVLSVKLWGHGGMDIAGNRSGDPLIKAVGNKARCTPGEDGFYCEAPAIENLQYLVDPSECPMPRGEDLVAIPACATIAGFWIGIEPASEEPSE